MRTPRIHSFHIGVFKRLGKNYSGTRVLAFWWGFTFIGILKFVTQIKQEKKDESLDGETYNRLSTIYSKNKFGYHTRIMSDFDNFLIAAFNEKFIVDSSSYYDDPVTQKEIEDVEAGLNSDMSAADYAHGLKDKEPHHEAGPAKCLRYPGRFGTNYEKTDDLSVYKVLPKGENPKW